MIHKPVKSSMIKSVGYSPESQKMEITFKNGDTYEYHNVQERYHALFMDSNSLGGFLTKHINPKFKFNKKNIKS